ncbi:MAG: hypothetical protein J5613_00525 [Alphaproteobacteria bacterium]|nr:hypothetical protein [Alphaproteobacteria bacterium]
MIKTDEIFDPIDDISCAWVPNGTEVAELAIISEMVVEKHMQYLSLPAGTVGTVWPWLENDSVGMLVRLGFANDVSQDDAMSGLATNVTDAFRHGASGVQVFVHYADIPVFVEMMQKMRDDLFFERYFSIAINIDEVPSNDWAGVFETLKKIRPNSILILADGDSFNPKSDFLGRVYAMLEKWDLDFALHIMFGKNMMRVSHVLRLVQKMQPKMMPDFRVFVIPSQE